MRAFVVWLCLAGCAAGGRPLEQWSLATPGDARATDVNLPVALYRYFHFSEADFTLTTEVALAAGEHGTLTLAIPCFHAALALYVDGAQIEDIGETGVGEHRFVIHAANQTSLHLVLTGHYSPRQRPFAAAPQLIIGAAPTLASATFDIDSTELAALIAAIVGLLYTVLFVLDHRREYAWISSGSAAGLVYCLWELGLLPTPLGQCFMAMAGAFTWLAVLEIAYIVFELGSPPRAWRILLGVYIVAPATYLLSPYLQSFGGATTVVIPVALYTFVAARCARVPRAFRSYAWILGPAYLAAAAACVPEAIMVLSGRNPIGGLHLQPAAVAVLSIAQLIVLVRQHVARTRDLARANSELQRQVAARSKDLADALAKLANKPHEPAADQVIDGRYRVLRKLGAGGMGSVHEVERIDNGQHLALKRIRGHGDPAALARFAREAQIAAELQHPNLVPVVDVGVAEGGLFLVMPLVDSSLDGMRSRFGDVAWAARVLREIAGGLAALHERGIVHRDLKPGNVLIASGVAKIADFGLAYFAEAPEEDVGAASALAKTVTGKLGRVGLTRAGDVFGTPPYMAPELAQGVHAAGPATDIFSFGVLAFELATGKSPFRDPPILAALAGGTPIPADTTLVPAALRDAIARCLAFEPAARPTAAQLLELLA